MDTLTCTIVTVLTHNYYHYYYYCCCYWLLFLVDTPLPNLRIPGVLQRFAATYLVVALTEAFASRVYRRKPPKVMTTLYQFFRAHG